MTRYLRSAFAIALSVLTLALAFRLVLADVGTPTIIAVTPGDSSHPQIAYANNITHVVWVESDWIMYSQNTGVSWTVPISMATGDEPSLIVDHNGTPQLVFTEFFSPTINVYHTRYVGNAWTLPRRVSLGSHNTSAPDIAVAPNNDLSIVWSEQVSTSTKQIEIAQSTNGGVAWPTVGPIIDAVGNAPKIAIGFDGVTHVIWQDDSSVPYRIDHAQRTTGAWSTTAIVSNNSASAFTPDLVAANNEAHVVYQQSNAIQYTHGANLTWSAPIPLSTGSATEPSIASNAIGSIVVAWDSGVSITLRAGGPNNWGSDQTLGSNPNGVSHVALASGPDNFVYGVFASGASGSRDIAFNYFVTPIHKTYLPLVLNNF